MSISSRWPIIVPVVIVGSIAAWMAWQRWQPLPDKAVPVPPPAVTEVALQAPPPATPASATAPPEIRFPVEGLTDDKDAALPAPKTTSSQVESQVSEALFGLLGRDNALNHLSLDGFANRVVVTVDNLTQKHASTRHWPVERTVGRFTIVQQGDSVSISPTNAARYDKFVRFIDAVDMKKAVRVYVRLYPRFQQAYEELGYPGKHFNDRLVDVIDHLLSTPSVSEPVAVRLTDIKGPYESTRPWVRYEFVDPTLEDRSAGQKMLLRMGPAHAQRIKLKLIELRVLLTRGAVVR